ncbi:hypothetical protein Desde_2560 [Desulfitobacterium dehalogenans ATCC 51507]|uniref:Uncharacterized protein n=2 Tax=Desulfitobacteriaceae TaxID=2937909 RepID=I4AAA5_DESDJ|nr:hypothetical protein Desde_2560 [Desulfitobacterium dehalogenans ATCC 51507]
MVMLSSHEDALEFIREFESSCREVLIAQGTSEHDLANAYLELQWKFLRMILDDGGILSHRSNRGICFNKSSSIA